MRLAERVPSCDILINNAGFASNARFDTIPPARMHEELLLDVVTLTELCRVYLPGMRERGAGRILNVASTAALLPGPFAAVYYAAKAYVLSFSQAIAEESRGSGVTVTCLLPGATATGFAQRAEMQQTLLFKMPMADAASVARAGYRAMLAGKDLEIPGLSNKLLAVLVRITPRRGAGVDLAQTDRAMTERAAARIAVTICRWTRACDYCHLALDRFYPRDAPLHRQRVCLHVTDLSCWLHLVLVPISRLRGCQVKGNMLTGMSEERPLASLLRAARLAARFF